jgi:hypothetical protein
VDLETLNSVINKPNGGVVGGVISTTALLFAPFSLVAWRVFQPGAEQINYFDG